jgi:glucosamine--fructose-6-phosphate aminotransferase (isomerizing)
MCGIAGYIGDGDAFGFISSALKKMEYRGYDSYGIRIGEQEHKQIGAPSNNIPDHMSGTIGIGHTRWATHGKVSIKNCHPVSYRGVHVVHNGTVENEQRHRERQDAEYKTETDTEIIAVELYNNPDSTLTSLENLDDIGSFVSMVDGSEGLCVYRGSTPLYYQEGKIASDLRAFEGVVRVMPENTSVFIDRYFKVPSDWKLVFVDKEDNADIECYMKHEIMSQSKIIRQLKLTNVKLPKTRLKFVACGSSYHAAMVAAYYMNKEANYDATVHYATEFIFTGHEDAIVFVSQSGETKDVIDALKRVDKDPIFIVQNKNESTLSQTRPDASVVNINAGIEVGVAATKTFSATVCQLMAMGGIDVGLNVIHKHLHPSFEPSRAMKFASTVDKYNGVLILGSGPFYPLALEAALKLKEVAYIHAEAMPADEIKHGPIALIPDTISIVIGNTSDRIENNVKQIESRGGKVLRMSGSWWTTLIDVQLLSYNVARIREIDPDKPRNLAKTITV